MKSISYIFSTIVICTVFVSYSLAQPQIEVSLDDSVFLVRQPIWIHSVLKNNLQKPIDTFAFRYEHDLFINLVNSRGEELEFKGMMEYYGTSISRKLNPNEETSYKRDLLNYFGEHESKLNWFKYLLPDKYKINVCLYKDNQYLYCSDTLIFTVIEPNNDDFLQQNLLIRARRLYDDKNYEEANLVYKKMVSEFPSGKYSDLALYESAITMGGRYKDPSIKVTLRLIMEYPNSVFSEFELQNIVDYFNKFKMNEDAKRLLEELNVKHPDTKAGRVAREILKSKKRTDEEK